jgi:hypothetical protein
LQTSLKDRQPRAYVPCQQHLCSPSHPSHHAGCLVFRDGFNISAALADVVGGISEAAICSLGTLLARQLVQLFNGVKIADIPVEQPTKFELVVGGAWRPRAVRGVDSWSSARLSKSVDKWRRAWRPSCLGFWSSYPPPPQYKRSPPVPRTLRKALKIRLLRSRDCGGFSEHSLRTRFALALDRGPLTAYP